MGYIEYANVPVEGDVAVEVIAKMTVNVVWVAEGRLPSRHPSFRYLGHYCDSGVDKVFEWEGG